MGDLTVAKCDKCSRDAVIYLRYSGAHLCYEHLDEFIMARVKREIRRSEHIPRKGGTVAIAVSGGKDSLAMAHALWRIMNGWRNVNLVAITVDEGIEGYRNDSIKLAEEFLSKLGIEHHVVSFRDEIGMPLDSMVSSGKLGEYAPCTYCGVFRRYLINRKARDVGASVIAFGHNLDDNAESVLMNVLRGDIEKILKLAPHRFVQRGMIPRILPFRWIPQREIYIYAMMHDIPIHTGECPYAYLAHRNLPQNLLAMAEENTPGTRHALLRLQDEIQTLGEMAGKYRGGEMNSCQVCGEPTSGSVCKACTFRKRLGLL